MSILGFTKNESIVVTCTLAVIAVAVGLNLQVSVRKSRDAQRKSDIRAIYDALLAYQNEFGFLPLSSEDGKIVACKGPEDERGVPTFVPCEWYKDSLRDIFDESYKPYLETIPGDPHTGKGAQYLYISNGRRFQLLASLEGKGEAEYDESIVARHLNCGNRVCNFGRASGQTPLNIPIEQYEESLEEDL